MLNQLQMTNSAGRVQSVSRTRLWQPSPKFGFTRFENRLTQVYVRVLLLLAKNVSLPSFGPEVLYSLSEISSVTSQPGSGCAAQHCLSPVFYFHLQLGIKSWLHATSSVLRHQCWCLLRYLNSTQPDGYWVLPCKPLLYTLYLVYFVLFSFKIQLNCHLGINCVGGPV